MKLLVANRGEIALRVIRTASELGISTVAVYADDDADTPHVGAADDAIALPGSGPSAYLDIAAMIDAVHCSGADAVHPGYGFLAENSDFARACAAAGVTFVGPDPQTLELFSDKASARAAATAAGVPVAAATEGGVGVEEVEAFSATVPAGIMIKALAGGGGRGMRQVGSTDGVAAAYRACVAEAELGFGDGRVFAEELLAGARHIEVQVIGDGSAALALGDRDCSVQRRHQKLIEIAPAAGLPASTRAALHADAVRLCASAGYRGLATVEFLVLPDRFVFLEVNPRIQVEHTVTEEVTGMDLVAAALAVASGRTLAECDLPPGVLSVGGAPATGSPAAARGCAMQVRVNLETMAADGSATATAGTLSGFTPPSGPGVRVDTFGRPGLTVGTRYDPLLAKVIVRAADQRAAGVKAATALDEFVIDGVATNIGFLRAVLGDEEFARGPVDTGYLDRRVRALVAALPTDTGPVIATGPVTEPDVAPGESVIHAPMSGTVVFAADEGAVVPAGEILVVLEAMKMQHEVRAQSEATVCTRLAEPGQGVGSGGPLLVISEGGSQSGPVAGDVAADPDQIRPDLAEVLDRHRVTRDEARPEAVAKRHRAGRRTARENILDLVDDGSLVEYGSLVLAAQKQRRTEADLIANAPADGLVCGSATIGAAEFGRDRARTVVMSYDYTVMAGTQGFRNHDKTDRMLELACDRNLPVVFFTEGGGGRPGETDLDIVAGLDVSTFRMLGSLRGRVPTVAVVSGRCFAGNAALAGTCEVIIATPDANIGMGGPAMVSGGGLGDFPPEAIGPIDIQRANGVVHLVADDETHAVALARQYLSYLQGPIASWEAPDVRTARQVVPENRVRAYDVRAAIEAIVDVDSILELRRNWGTGVVTALVRVEGRPFGLIANNGLHLGGAIDHDGADKLADFLELCEAHGLPLISLCDTPGFMVGPEAEKHATVRRFSRLFVIGSRLTVPMGAVLLRKGYGLGAMAMTGGSFRAPQFTVAWPTGEIGGMGLEGAVRLGYSKELAAARDDAARTALYDDLVAQHYARGRALSAAGTFELDEVIDPADTRDWIATL